ncbi:MAG: hypothetical protein KGV50_02495 [Gammaproteobacteria bacterium]|nr:hypothetical protein [Gammaproteobacteria bacterium]
MNPLVSALTPKPKPKRAQWHDVINFEFIWHPSTPSCYAHWELKPIK